MAWAALAQQSTCRPPASTGTSARREAGSLIWRLPRGSWLRPAPRWWFLGQGLPPLSFLSRTAQVIHCLPLFPHSLYT